MDIPMRRKKSLENEEKEEFRIWSSHIKKNIKFCNFLNNMIYENDKNKGSIYNLVT